MDDKTIGSGSAKDTIPTRRHLTLQNSRPRSRFIEAFASRLGASWFRKADSIDEVKIDASRRSNFHGSAHNEDKRTKVNQTSPTTDVNSPEDILEDKERRGSQKSQERGAESNARGADSLQGPKGSPNLDDAFFIHLNGIAAEPQDQETKENSDQVPVQKEKLASSSAEQGAAREYWETQTVPLSATGTKLWRSHRDLYYVLPSHMSVSKEALALWFDEVRDRLWYDLEPVRSRIYKKGQSSHPADFIIEQPELRMSGRLTPGADSVKCSPAIWILCGSKLCKQYVERSVKKMAWLQSTRFVIEIHVGAPLFATGLQANITRDRLELKYPIALPDGNTLYLHRESRPYVPSAIGRLLCATVMEGDTIISQRISRLGGLVFLNQNTPFYLTTAHGIIDHVTWPTLPGTDIISQSDDDGDDDDPGYDDIGSVSDTSSDQECLDCESAWKANSSPISRLGDRDSISLNAMKWHPVTRSGIINFLGQGTRGLRAKSAFPELISTFERSVYFRVQATDFALFQAERENADNDNQDGDGDENTNPLFDNCYRPKVKSWVWVTQPDSSLDAGPVQVLESEEATVGGYLLAAESSIHFRGVVLKTRKIELPLPLAQGTSGSWVVRDHFLCGMIIAVYDRDPFAHMIAVNDLFSSIDSCHTFGAAVRITRFPETLSTEELESNDDEVLENENPRLNPIVDRFRQIWRRFRGARAQREQAGFQHRIAADFPEVPGEEFRNAPLLQIRRQLEEAEGGRMLTRLDW